jgi:hypothetical protein
VIRYNRELQKDVNMANEQGKENETVHESLNYIKQKLNEIAYDMEKLGISEYLDMLHNPKRLFITNFWAGIFRGFGMAVGFTILAGVVIYILREIITLNIPVIGDFIAEIVRIVQVQLHAR